jgi:hypothetical protein
VVGTIDVLDGAISPAEIMSLDLPFVIDLVKAKVRLEQNKSKAQKAARELEALSKRGR